MWAGRSGDPIPVRAKISAPVQTGPGPHTASCKMGTGSFPGVKSGQGVTLTPHPLLVPWSRKSSAIPLLPLRAVRPVPSLTACIWVHFTQFMTTLHAPMPMSMIHGFCSYWNESSSIKLSRSWTTNSILYISILCYVMALPAHEILSFASSTTFPCLYVPIVSNIKAVYKVFLCGLLETITSSEITQSSHKSQHNNIHIHLSTSHLLKVSKKFYTGQL